MTWLRTRIPSFVPVLICEVIVAGLILNWLIP